MSEEDLSREEFAQAASAAVRAVLDLYGEVDALLRELDGAMREAGFQAWAVIPGSGRGDESNRLLRTWKGRIYLRAEEDDVSEDEEGEESEDGEESEEDGGRRRSAPREIPQGATLAFARVQVYRPRDATFAPEVSCGVLTNVRADVEGLLPEEPLRVRRSHLRRLLQPLTPSTGAGAETVLQTTAPILLNRKNVRARDRRLTITVPEKGIERVELYDIATLEKVHEVAERLIARWERHAPGGVGSHSG